jgi:hypothetical protein
LALDEERLETLQIIRDQLPDVDDAFAAKLLKQVDVNDEQQLDQEIQVIQDRINKTRQKIAAANAPTAAPNEVIICLNFLVFPLHQFN